MRTEIKVRNKGGREAVIDIEGVIGVSEECQFDDPQSRTATYARLSAQLERLAAMDAGRVVVNIRSVGGDVGDALLIYDALRAMKATVVTRCYGYVASAATIIAQAASPGCREISANALYLIHQAACAAEGNSQDMSQAVSMLDKTDGRIAGIYAARSGRDVSIFEELMGENGGRGRWLTPQETVEVGLADRVIGGVSRPDNMAGLMAAAGLPPLPEGARRGGWRDLLSAVRNALFAGYGRGDVGGEQMDGRIAAMAREWSASDMEYEGRIEGLERKIAVLEAQNAKFRAVATRTLPKEDPSYGDRRMTVNEEAYMNDLKSFR